MSRAWRTLLGGSLVLAALAGCAPAPRVAEVVPDYAREQRWADEIVPGLVVGEALRLEAAGGRKFLGILTAAKRLRGAVILVHGAGVHPDWGVIGALRALLADRGYTTLSIQMPVLAAGADPGAYSRIFAEADARIAAAVAYLRARKAGRLAIVSHSMGARMAQDFVRRHADAPLAAWAPLAISSGRFEGIGSLKFPVFDVYAEKDLEQVKSGAADRAAVLKGIRDSRQAMVYGADHFFAKKEKELADLLDTLLAPVMR